MRYLFLLLLVAAATVQAQQMYRWTDKQGKVNYGPTPPPGVAAKAVKGTASEVAPQTPATASQSSSSGRRPDEGKPRIDPTKRY
jgi:hypothetical protein